jgi:hypothetical protein
MNSHPGDSATVPEIQKMHQTLADHQLPEVEMARALERKDLFENMADYLKTRDREDGHTYTGASE